MRPTASHWRLNLVPFARSVAATALSFGEPCVMNDLAAAANVEPQPFERSRSALLAAPLAVGPGVQAVLELFDRPGGFRDEDRRLAAAAAEIGAELLRQALAERAGPANVVRRGRRRPGSHAKAGSPPTGRREPTRPEEPTAGRGPRPAAGGPGIGPIAGRRRRSRVAAGRGGPRIGGPPRAAGRRTLHPDGSEPSRTCLMDCPENSAEC